MSYLTRREGRYSYRRRFPTEVAELIGRTEYRKALGTADRSEAARLSRVVSVEFDRICDAALSAPVISPEEPSEPVRSSAAEVLASLDAVVRSFTLDIVERMQTPGWQREIEWRRQGLEAQAAGLMPPGVQMHPVTARAALRALQSVLDGNPLPVHAETAKTPARVETAHESSVGACTAEEFELVLTEYCEGVSAGRAKKVRSLSKKILVWPSEQAAQMQRIMQYCTDKLAGGGKASSVHSDAYGLLSVLRRIPGWAGLSLPKAGATAKAVRSGAGMNKEQREPIPLERMLALHADIKAKTPAHYPAAVLLARYGLRPSELLQEGPDALAYRTDIMGKKELVFKAALSGGKNASSRRDLPVAAEDAPLFKSVLANFGLAAGASKTQRDTRIRQRVRSLSRVFSRALGEDSGLSLYSQRHTCADLLRAVGATTDEVGGILGHTPAGAKATSIYGGSQPLDRPRALLVKVRELIPD